MARLVTLWVLAAGAGLPVLADDPFEGPEYQFDFDPSLRRPWTEAASSLPAPPAGRLLEARRAPTTAGRWWVDPRSLRSDRDGVVRLTYVIESEAGARTTRFEGIRCDTRQFRTYAYLDHRGRWQVPRKNPWRPIRDQGLNTYRYDLYHYYLCDEGDDDARSAREILRRLRYYPEDNEP